MKIIGFMDNLYQSLKESPLFNLSLADKELFHSNFLAWLAERKETRHLFIEVIKSLSKKDVLWADEFINHSENFLIKREYNHFDLCIVQVKHLFYKNGKPKNDLLLPVLVLENKNKSLPDNGQLRRYEDTVKEIWGNKYDKESITYILLSLATEFPDKEMIDNDKTWSFCSYGDLAKALKPAISLNTYYYYLINDYVRFISILHELSQKWLKISTYLVPNDEWKLMNECRIHDICDKIRHCHFVSIYKEKYKDDIKTFYTKGAALGWGCKKNNIDITIQIQNGEYRHAIVKSDKSPKIGKNYNMHNKNGRKWIKELGVEKFLKVSNDDEAFEIDNKVLDNAIYPQIEERLFNVFETVGENGYKFLYQYKRIKQDATIEEVLDYLHRDIERIKIEVAN